MKEPCVYILASRYRGTLYIGVTSNLITRISEHRLDIRDGFTKTHGVHLLVWYEAQVEMCFAIAREKQLKNWHRDWKIAMIERENPEWKDLYPLIAGEV